MRKRKRKAHRKKVMWGIEKRKEKNEPVHFHRMYDNQIMPLKISSRRLRKPKTKAERGWWHGRRGEEEKGKGSVEGKKRCEGLRKERKRMNQCISIV